MISDSTGTQLRPKTSYNRRPDKTERLKDRWMGQTEVQRTKIERNGDTETKMANK